MTEEDIEENFIFTLTSNTKERTTKKEKPIKINDNIVNRDIECLKNKKAGSCEAGMEIIYMVNDSLEKTFNVLHDDGNTLTSINWYSESNENSKCSITALTELENITSDWDNVNTLNYTIVATNFNGTNAYTGCDLHGNCTENKYTLGSRSGKARMITVQEAASVGCSEESKSCPSWRETSEYYLGA